jgi:hypothetical protein
MCINHSFRSALLHMPIKWGCWCLHYWWPQMNSCMFFKLFAEVVSFVDCTASVVGKWVWVLSVGGMILKGEQKYCGYWCIHCSTGIFIEVEYYIDQKQTNTDLFLGCLTLKMKGLWHFAVLGAAHPVTAYYIPEDLNLHLKIMTVLNAVLGVMMTQLCMFCDNLTP